MIPNLLIVYNLMLYIYQLSASFFLMMLDIYQYFVVNNDPSAGLTGGVKPGRLGVTNASS